MNQDDNVPSEKRALEIVQSVLKEGRSIALFPQDLALLLLIWDYMRSKELLFAITDSEIRLLGERLDSLDLRDTPLQKAEKRYTESIGRLLKNECLSRADMNRLIASDDTEYQLTSLGDSIATWHFEHQQFTGEPLTAILRTFNSNLLRITLDAENSAIAPEKWRAEVLSPLRWVLSSMLSDVARHQKELDRRHDALRKFIPSLLTENSETSIKSCEEQLSNVIHTITDLQEVSLAETNVAFQNLDRIASIGGERGFHETEPVCADIERKLNAILLWTTQRAKDWVEHHQVVHNFLRTIIYIERGRRITEALKKAVAVDPQWTLQVVEAMPFMRFREDSFKTPERRQPPRRAKKDYRPELIEIERDPVPAMLKSFIEEETGDILLSQTLKRAASKGIPAGRLIYHLPRCMAMIIEKGRVDYKFRPWEKITEILEVEELKVRQNDNK